MICGPISRQVRLGRLDALREVDRQSEQQSACYGHHLFADPGEREKGDKLVGIVLGVKCAEVGRHGDEILVGQHRQLRKSRGSRCGADPRHIFRFRIFHVPFELSGMILFVALPDLDDVGKIGEQVRIVFGHPLRVVVDDLFYIRQVFLHVEDLVDLLLILGDDEFRLGVVDDVGDLFQDRILIYAGSESAGRLRGELGDDPFGLVVADDGNLVSRLKAEAYHAERKIFYLFEVLFPGKGLPDAEVFFPERDFPSSVLFCLFQEQLGKCIRRHVPSATVREMPHPTRPDTPWQQPSSAESLRVSLRRFFRRSPEP